MSGVEEMSVELLGRSYGREFVDSFRKTRFARRLTPTATVDGLDVFQKETKALCESWFSSATLNALQNLFRLFLPRTMLTILLVASAPIFSGCQHTYREVPVAGTPTRPKLPTDSTVYVAIPPDARYQNLFVANSGQVTAVAIRDAFAKYVKRAYVGRKVQDYTEGLETARTNNCTYFVYPAIARWEDHATELSGRRDQVEIKVEVADAASGAILHATILRGQSRWFTDGGDTPQDLLAEPIRNYVASLFQPIQTPSALR